MCKKMILMGLCVASFAVHVTAQTVTGTEFTMAPSDTFTDSSHAMSNYGLTWADFSNGTTGPSAMLSGYGGINLYTLGTRRMTITIGGNVGVGSSSPNAPLQVVGAVVAGTFNGFNATDNFAETLPISAGTNKSYTFSHYGLTWADFSNGTTGPSAVLSGYGGINLYTLGTRRMTITTGGNVGIGTTSPGSTLEVSGNIALTSGKGGSIVFQDGSKQSTAWTGSLCGGDYAESVDVSDDRTKYGPGDLLVIDPNNPGKFLKSAEPYSASVLGVYSTKPGVLGRRQTTEKSLNEIPMAMIGIVPTKVSAENGAIKPGDLLVSSSTPGYAMKGTDRSQMLGAVLGKALGSLESGTGVIEVGITLQ